jgi:hypothetical protein
MVSPELMLIPIQLNFFGGYLCMKRDDYLIKLDSSQLKVTLSTIIATSHM